MAKDISDIKADYKEAVDGWRDIYDEATNDLCFVYDVGEGQWPDAIRKKRETDRRPIITVNKLQKFVRQLRGDAMMNRPRIKVIPVDSKADPQKAELFNGLIRQIEYLSSAEIAYDTAYMHAVSSSVGFWRIVTKYADDMSFNQDIFIKRILNPTAVHFDPFATEFTLSDARYCFVEDMIDKKEYERLYGKDNAIDWSGDPELFGEWIQADKIRIAEYFYKEPTRKRILLLKSGDIVPVENKDTIEALKAMGHEIMRERFVDSHVVKWRKVNGHDILDEAEWPGKDIPVIPVFGDEVIVEGKKYYLSLARGAKGPQQMYNYWATAATETVALAPKMPFIVDHRQIKGFENEWEDANTKNRMYIRYNAVPGQNKPSREAQTQIPSAIMNMMQTTAFDIEDHLGRYEASNGQASNERSGKAIIARVQQSDKGTYTFVDNFSRAIVYTGRQLVDLIPKIYDTKRALRVMGEDGTEKLVEVNSPIGLDENDNPIIANDLTVGQFDLIASVGASYSSKRQEMVDTLIQALQYAPQFAGVIAPLVFKYSDAPASQEVYEEIKKGIEQQQQIMAAQGQAGAA